MSVPEPDTEAEELIRLDIPALPAFVGVARVVVASVAMTVDGIAGDRLEDLRIAVSEACTNAVEANLADAVERRVVLRCLLHSEALEIRVEDTNHASAPPDGVGESAERGWGLQLIRALVDDVAFLPATADAGSAVRLIVRRASDA